MNIGKIARFLKGMSEVQFGNVSDIETAVRARYGQRRMTEKTFSITDEKGERFMVIVRRVAPLRPPRPWMEPTVDPETSMASAYRFDASGLPLFDEAR
jgi:hypothetical protein